MPVYVARHTAVCLSQMYLFLRTFLACFESPFFWASSFYTTIIVQIYEKGTKLGRLAVMLEACQACFG